MNTSWWRGVGPTHNLFVVESFMDEPADASRQDPVAFRRAVLQENPRALAAPKLAAKQSGWGEILPPGRGRSVSFQFAFRTHLACAVEVEAPQSGDILLKPAVVAVDCSLIVNPDTTAAAPALGNAIFAATSRRVRNLPGGNAKLGQA